MTDTISKTALKEKVWACIDENADSIIQLGRALWATPELGYKEFKTTEKITGVLKDLGLEVQTPLAITGCKASLNEGKEGPSIAMLSELDALTCPDHPDADPETGAVHACGHNVMMASMYGVALGLVKSGAYEWLDGKIHFMAVPAEECIEIDYRTELKNRGDISYFGGKQELITRGHFDDVDIAVMFHPLNTGEAKAEFGSCGNGFINKKVVFHGKEAHAGSMPELGVNALYAANLALNNINANRETFRDEDKVRIHPIITKGGDVVNNIPHDVHMEGMCRAKTLASIVDASHKFNRSVRGAAVAMGADCTIEEVTGYLPLIYHKPLSDLFVNNISELVGKDKVVRAPDHAASSDIGDVSQIMPAIHPSVGGLGGVLHTRTAEVKDEVLAYITSAKAFSGVIIDLLWNGGEVASKVLKQCPSEMTKEAYLEYLESNTRAIHYKESATAQSH